MKPSDLYERQRAMQVLPDVREKIGQFDEDFGPAIDDTTILYRHFREEEGMSDTTAALLTLATVMLLPEEDE